MGFGIPPIALALLAAAPVAAADLPDTSERFREAMSACTLPGPGLDRRLARLAETGWTAARPDAEDAFAFRDAALLAEPPETWPGARDAGPVALPETIYRHGTARLIVSEDPASGDPACRLATLNSIDSDLLFADLAAVGAVSGTGPVRSAAMATSVFDLGEGHWRTEVTLISADTGAANALLDAPLRITLSAVFVTRQTP